MITSLISRLVILTCGTLYPAYRSYKAVKTKSVRDYVKWMMYWIVFALFLCAETVSDVLVSWWMPFYYEIKIVFLLWLLSPYTKGSSILYRRFVHPMLTERENEIDDVISRAKEEGYRFILRMGSQGITMFSNVALQLIMRGPSFLDQLRSGFEAADHAPRQPQRQRLVRVDGELDNREGREDGTVPKREAEPVDEEIVHEVVHGDAGGDAVREDYVDGDVLPDIPGSDFVFRAPQNPPSPTSASTAAKKERPASKTRKRGGKSPGRAASSSRNNASRTSDASDVDDCDGGSEKGTTSRDANSNNVKSRGRRAVGGDGEVNERRDRSRTKIPRGKATQSSARRDVAFDDVLFDEDNDDYDPMLISSDDDAVKSTAKGAKSGIARQRKAVKKKTTTLTTSSAVDL